MLKTSRKGMNESQEEHEQKIVQLLNIMLIKWDI